MSKRRSMLKQLGVGVLLAVGLSSVSATSHAGWFSNIFERNGSTCYGQLAANAFDPGYGQLPAGSFGPGYGQLPANSFGPGYGQLPANSFGSFGCSQR